MRTAELFARNTSVCFPHWVNLRKWCPVSILFSTSSSQVTYKFEEASSGPKSSKEGSKQRNLCSKLWQVTCFMLTRQTTLSAHANWHLVQAKDLAQKETWLNQVQLSCADYQLSTQVALHRFLQTSCITVTSATIWTINSCLGIWSQKQHLVCVQPEEAQKYLFQFSGICVQQLNEWPRLLELLPCSWLYFITDVKMGHIL